MPSVPPPPLTTTVVIPVKNDAVHLAACLRALSGQTLAPDEVVVVDNDCSDDSVAVAIRWGARIVVESETGIPQAASTGYDSATNDLILRLDADSVPPAGWVADIVRAFAADPSMDALTGPGTFDDLGGVAARLADRLYMDAYFRSMTAALAHPPLFGSNFAMRREAWASVSGSVHRRDAYVHDDIDLSIHLGRTHRIVLDRALRVGISGRPFHRLDSLVVRFHRAWHTLVVHGLRDSAPYRWRRVLLGRAEAPGQARAVGRGEAVSRGEAETTRPSLGRRVRRSIRGAR